MIQEKNDRAGRGDVFEIKLSVSLLSAAVLLASVALFLKTFFISKGYDAPPLAEQVKSVAWFFVVTWGFGASLRRYLKIKANPIESFFVNVSLGLGILPIITVILNTIGIPLHWFVFLALSLAIPSTVTFRSRAGVTDFFRSLKTWDAFHASLPLFFACILFYVYLSGAFAYPWLEDGDSWQHATGVKYVSIFNTYSIPSDMFVSHYLEPYPPTYDALLGVVHQLNTSVSWTLKYFNSLIVSLAVVFAYVFVRKFSGDARVAVYSSFFLAAAPNFMSHFIWAQSLGVVLFFPALYCLECIRDNRLWIIPAALISSSILVVQTSTAFTFGLFFFVYISVKSLMEKRPSKRVFFAVLGGLLLSLALYWIPETLKFGFKGVTNKIFFGQPADVELSSTPYLSNLGSTDYDLGRTYGLLAFIHAANPTHIPQPEGVGEVLFLLVILSLISFIMKPKVLTKSWLAVSVGWLFLSIAGLESAVLPINVTPSRFWTFLAISAAVVCGKGFSILLESTGKHAFMRKTLLAAIITGVLITSALPKYIIQTSMWPYGIPLSEDQFRAYMMLKQLPPNTPVFTACYLDDIVIGFDKLAFPWDREVINFRKNSLPYVSPEELRAWLDDKGFRYTVIDLSCLKECSKREDSGLCTLKWKDLKERMDSSSLFKRHYQNYDSAIYELV
jgi:hypothetical protein